MSSWTTLIYLSHCLLIVALLPACPYIPKIVYAEISPVEFSRMAGRGRGRGRAGGDPPPPPDYMASMMQQFALNQQFMQGLMA